MSESDITVFPEGGEVKVAADILGWSEESGRARGYAEASQLVDAVVVEAPANAEGVYRCEVTGVPSIADKGGEELVKLLAYGDVVSARARGRDYAANVLCSELREGASLFDLGSDAEGKAHITGSHELSEAEASGMIEPYAKALFYQPEPVPRRSGYGSALLRLPRGYDFLAAEVFEEALRGYLGEGTPLYWPEKPETLEAALGDHLYKRDLLFALPPDIVIKDAATFIEEHLLECGIEGTSNLSVSNPSDLEDPEA